MSRRPRLRRVGIVRAGLGCGGAPAAAGRVGPLRHGRAAAQVEEAPTGAAVRDAAGHGCTAGVKSIDDALDSLDLLMVTELAGRAHRQADKARIRRWPRFAKASSRLAAAVEMLLEAAEWGEDVRLAEVLEMIDAVVARPDLPAAVAEVTGAVPPPDADDDGGWRAEMASRYPTVAGLVKTLISAIAFGASTEGHAVLAATRGLAGALAVRSHHHSVTLLPRGLIDACVVGGVWKRLVFGHPARTADDRLRRYARHHHARLSEIARQVVDTDLAADVLAAPATHSQTADHR